MAEQHAFDETTSEPESVLEDAVISDHIPDVKPKRRKSVPNKVMKFIFRIEGRHFAFDCERGKFQKFSAEHRVLLGIGQSHAFDQDKDSRLEYINRIFNKGSEKMAPVEQVQEHLAEVAMQGFAEEDPTLGWRLLPESHDYLMLLRKRSLK